MANDGGVWTLAECFTECDEVAQGIAAPSGATMDECLELVTLAMPDETMTIRSNVAESLYLRARRAASHDLRSGGLSDV